MEEPTEERAIHSFVADTFADEDSGSAGIYRTVLPTRTFLEKIFLLAEEFQKVHPRYSRMSRHLYDLERLMDSEYGKAALEDDALYDAIVEHRRTYYALKYVNYDLHARNTIQFVPPIDVQDAWRRDYEDMRNFFIYGQALDFDKLMERIRDLQNRIRG